MPPSSIRDWHPKSGDVMWAKGWRWMRRHKTLVSGMAILLVSVLVAATAGLILLDRANQQIAAERNTARTAAEQSQAVNDFLTRDLLGQADPDVNDRTKKITVEELLNRAARKIDNNTKIATQPEIEASLQLTIGTTFFKLGNYREADKHLRRAMGLRRDALGPRRPPYVGRPRIARELLESRTWAVCGGQGSLPADLGGSH
jgi:hypothetical protein